MVKTSQTFKQLIQFFKQSNRKFEKVMNVIQSNLKI